MVRILLALFVLLVPSSANDAFSAPRVFLSFKGKRSVFSSLVRSVSPPDVPGSRSCLFVCLLGYKEPPGRFIIFIMIVSELYIFFFYTSESGFVMTV